MNAFYTPKILSCVIDMNKGEFSSDGLSVKTMVYLVLIVPQYQKCILFYHNFDVQTVIPHLAEFVLWGAYHLLYRFGRVFIIGSNRQTTVSFAQCYEFNMCSMGKKECWKFVRLGRRVSQVLSPLLYETEYRWHIVGTRTPFKPGQQITAYLRGALPTTSVFSLPNQLF